jgi:predicted RNA polymerase sigma factor
VSAASTAAVEAAFRRERVAVLATLIRQLGDFQLAEDAVQEAFAAAIVAWERDGVPARPRGSRSPRGGVRSTACAAIARWPTGSSA